MIDGVPRRAAWASGGSGRAPAKRRLPPGRLRRAHASERLLPLLHLAAVVVAEQVQQAVHERSAPLLADDLWAEDDVAELPRYLGGKRVPPVDREREDVGRLVDPEMLALERAHLLRPDERHAEVSRHDLLRGEHAAAERLDLARLDADAAAIDDLDLEHGRRSIGSPAVPVRRPSPSPRPAVRRTVSADAPFPSPRHGACTPRRCSGRACAGRRPGCRTR